MGGIVGVASKEDCTLDLFFGIDYHSLNKAILKPLNLCHCILLNFYKFRLLQKA